MVDEQPGEESALSPCRKKAYLGGKRREQTLLRIIMNSKYVYLIDIPKKNKGTVLTPTEVEGVTPEEKHAGFLKQLWSRVITIS